MRVGIGALLPLTAMLIPVLQSVPLPTRLRALVDPRGTALLADNSLVLPLAWPLSLDPVSTRIDAGIAAAALAVFIVAYHLASGQRRRHLFLRALGVTGLLAVAIGMAHAVFSIPKIYGVLSVSNQKQFIGPFVNANHTAEFLELAAFVCVACAELRLNALNRVGWYTGALLCAAGSLATLSRGAVLGLAAGGGIWVLLRIRAREQAGSVRSRKGVLVGAVVILAILGAFALGAGKIVDSIPLLLCRHGASIRAVEGRPSSSRCPSIRNRAGGVRPRIPGLPHPQGPVSSTLRIPRKRAAAMAGRFGMASLRYPGRCHCGRFVDLYASVARRLD